MAWSCDGVKSKQHGEGRDEFGEYQEERVTRNGWNDDVGNSLRAKNTDPLIIMRYLK